MKKQMRISMLVAGGLLAMVCAAQAADATTSGRAFQIYPFYEHYEWKESHSGQQLLKESGPMIGLGGHASFPLGSRLSFEFGGDAFFGQVDYDGGIQNADGTATPYKTQTSYSGLEGQADFAMKFPLGPAASLTPAAGFGFRTWRRELDTSSYGESSGKFGYTEYWITTHFILGATLDIALGTKSGAYIEGDVRLPVWTDQEVDLSNLGGPDNVGLQPDAQTTWHAEGGFRYGKFFAAVFYENLDFKASGSDASGNFIQPDSKATMTGIKAGLCF